MLFNRIQLALLLTSGPSLKGAGASAPFPSNYAVFMNEGKKQDENNMSHETAPSYSSG